MHDFIKSLPCFGFFIGFFGTIFTMDGSLKTAFVFLAVMAVSACILLTHKEAYGID